MNLDSRFYRTVFNVLAKMVCLNRTLLQVELGNTSVVMRGNNRMSATVLRSQEMNLKNSINLNRGIRSAVSNVSAKMICLNRLLKQEERGITSVLMRGNDRMSATVLGMK